jgi:CHAD domain-containing protein
MPQPIVTFLRHSAILKAMMAECADTPKLKAVHRLRSTTRRMEAILELLTASTNLPNRQQNKKSFRNYLRKIRRAAGKVRDIDVHLEILATYKTIGDAKVMEKDLNAARKKSAEKLQRRILKSNQDILHALDNLETTLAPFVDLNLSGESLAHAAQSWLATAVRGLDPQHDDDLHSIRKACKTARYIAEVGSETSKTAASLAKRMNDIQKATGTWHDYLLLLNEAHASLPNDSPLIEKIHVKALQLRRKAESRARPLHNIVATRLAAHAQFDVH